MVEDVRPEEIRTVVLGESAGSPARAPADALALTLEAGRGPGTRPLTLHGFFNIGVDMTGRYSSSFPSPIFVVAISRETGHVHIQRLINQDEIPPRYRGAAAEPAITRADGMSAAGISESGFFDVDLKAHLGLAGDEGIYEVFLWIEDVLSDMASAQKPAEPDGGIGATLFKRPPSIAEIEPLPGAGKLTLSTELRDGQLWFKGQSGKDPVSVIAYVLQSQQPAWTVLSRVEGEKAGGLSFAFKASDLLPGIGPGDRILAVAVSDGHRTPLIDVTVSH